MANNDWITVMCQALFQALFQTNYLIYHLMIPNLHWACYCWPAIPSLFLPPRKFVYTFIAFLNLSSSTPLCSWWICFSFHWGKAMTRVPTTSCTYLPTHVPCSLPSRLLPCVNHPHPHLQPILPRGHWIPSIPSLTWNVLSPLIIYSPRASIIVPSPLPVSIIIQDSHSSHVEK